MFRRTTIVAVLAGVAALSVGCATDQKLLPDADRAVQRFKATDPDLKPFFDGAAGYVVFPTVGKGGAGIVAAYGRGVLYEKGKPVGFSDLSQGGIGAVLGGQSYSEIIFLENAAALEKFKSGNFAFAAQASAVALKSGAGANAKYADGVAVFTANEAGLMFEASIGGQKFSYEPIMK